VKAKFGGKVTLSDLDPPNGYTISGEGSGGAAGFAKGGAKVALEDAPAGPNGGGTLLKYQVNAQIGGKLAQIGSRLVDGAARKMADEFFTAFAGVVEAQAGTAQTAEIPTPMPAAETIMAPGALPPIDDAKAANTASKGLPPVVWIGGLIVVAAAVVWWATRS
jgi:hypothetical protein